MSEAREEMRKAAAFRAVTLRIRQKTAILPSNNIIQVIKFYYLRP
jgi:hypothetical protein